MTSRGSTTRTARSARTYPTRRNMAAGGATSGPTARRSASRGAPSGTSGSIATTSRRRARQSRSAKPDTRRPRRSPGRTRTLRCAAPPTASGPAPHYSYAWTPCDENGEVDGDDDDDELFHSAASEEAADDELGSFSWGGFVRRTAPDGTHEYDWGGGYRATLVEAIAAVLGLGDVDDDEEDLEDEELDDEKLRELCENPNDSPARWFRVAGFGLSGAPARSAKNAWASYELAGRREYGYKACDQGTSRARHSAGLVAGTTWRAVESADVSEVSGTCRRGMWWRCRGNIAPTLAAPEKRP